MLHLTRISAEKCTIDLIWFSLNVCDFYIRYFIIYSSQFIQIMILVDVGTHVQVIRCIEVESVQEIFFF
jgi:hypothetical protein